MGVSATVAIVVLGAIGIGIWRHRQVAPPTAVTAEPAMAAAPAPDLSALVAEAKREL
jgi:hypothetical protein